VEDPSHRWRTRTVAASGLEVVPVPVDEDGLRVEAIPDVPALVVSADHQFPLSAGLSPERRRALAEWAAAGDRLVIEHDYDAHFRYDRQPIAALQSLAPEHVAYVGTASALLAPTVRLGWAVLPARLVEPVVERLSATALSTSRLTQLALAEFIARGYLDRHLRKAGGAYRRRRENLVELLAAHVPDAKVTGSAAGFFLSLSLPPSTSEERLLEESRSRGVMLDGWNEHSLLPQAPGLAFGFSGGPEASMRGAMRLFVEAFAAAS
jgi:GntR family transcriptional regulator / MocR family aminotransferase